MSDTPTYHDTATGRGPWESSPERRPEVMQSAPRGNQRTTDATELEALRERTASAEAALTEAADLLLDASAYETTSFEDPAAAAQTADTLLTSGGPERLAAFVDGWAAEDPQAAAAWATDREARMHQILAQRESQATHDAYAAAEAARLAEIEQWRSRRNDPTADALAALAPQTNGTAEEFELVHEGLREAEYARQRIGRAQEAWGSFRDPSVVGVRALDKRTGERREPVRNYADDEAAVASQMRPLRHQRRAAREQEIADFRAAFREEARPKYLPGGES